MEVTLFSTGCPLCNILKDKLEKAEIPYVVCEDVDYMTSIGIQSVPELKVDEEPLKNFSQALKWIHDIKPSEEGSYEY